MKQRRMANGNVINDPWLTTQEIAAKFSIGEQTVRDAIHRGDLPARRRGRRQYIAHIADCERVWLASL